MREDRRWQYLPDGMEVHHRVEVLLEARRISTCVYFVMALGTDTVRIGYSAALKRRLASIQGGCPGSIMLAGLLPGCTRTMLGQIRIFFAPSHLHHDWYALDDRMLEFLGILHGHGTDAALRHIVDTADPGLSE